jgi:ribulose-5-phosphate 4-epimerase/fuculose-1-phosphate aldolase
MLRDEIWQARVDLAAAYRLANRFGLNEGIDNHFTLMVPGSRDRFLLNAFGLHWSEVTASNLLVVDAKGKVVEGEGEAETTAVCIHAPIHVSNARAACIMHTHMPYATALSMIEGGRLEPASQTALRFYDEVAYDEEYNGLAMQTDEGERLGKVLDGKRILLMANHGITVIGGSVAEAFNDLYFFERACHVQFIAMQSGKALKKVPTQIAQSTFSGIDPNRHARLHFDALKRVLDREEPDYAR